MQGGSRHHLRRTAAGIVFAAALFYSVNIPSVRALSSSGIGGHPTNVDPGIQYSDSWFIYSLDLGESKEDSLTLQNASDEAQTIKIYAVDSVATGDGNFSLHQEQDPRLDVGAWITMNQDEVTLQPGEEKTIPFVITIPENADAGEHSGGIIIQKSAMPTAGGGNAGASIITRVGIRIYETVPGEIIRKIEPSDFSVTQQAHKGKPPIYRIQLEALNKSNVSIKTNVVLHITGWGKIKYFPKSHFKDGISIDFSDFASFFKGETLPNSWLLLRDQKVSTNWEWPRPAFGQYTFQADVSYDGAQGPETFSTEKITVTVIPWTLILWLLGILIAITAYFLLRRLRSSGRGWQQYTVKSGDQLTTIASMVGVNWKRLASVNKIKAPFIIQAGQTLLIPAAHAKAVKETTQKQATPEPVKQEQETPEAAPVKVSIPVSVAATEPAAPEPVKPKAKRKVTKRPTRSRVAKKKDKL